MSYKLKVQHYLKKVIVLCSLGNACYYIYRKGEHIITAGKYERYCTLPSHNFLITKFSVIQGSLGTPVFRLIECNPTFRLFECNPTFRLIECKPTFRLFDCNPTFRLIECNPTFRHFECTQHSHPLSAPKWIKKKVFKANNRRPS